MRSTLQIPAGIVRYVVVFIKQAPGASRLTSLTSAAASHASVYCIIGTFTNGNSIFEVSVVTGVNSCKPVALQTRQTRSKQAVKKLDSVFDLNLCKVVSQ